MSMPPRVAALYNLLESHPEQLLLKASDGDVEACTVLCNTIGANPGLIPLGALQVFYTHLNSRNIPLQRPSSIAVAEKVSHLAYCSLVGLTNVGPLIKTESSLAVGALKAWPEVWKWVLHMFRNRQNYTSVASAGLWTVLSGTLYTLSMVATIDAEMKKTEGFFKVVAQLWLSEDIDHLAASLPTAALLICSLLVPNAQAEWLDEILEESKRSSDEWAKKAVARVNKSSMPEHLIGTIGVLNALSKAPHPLRYSLLSVGSVPAVTKSLVRVGNMIQINLVPILLPKNDKTLDAIETGFGYLHNVLESTDGFTWVTQAIRSGLFSAIVNCCGLFTLADRGSRRMFLGLVGRILPSYLVYASVLRAAWRALAKLDLQDVRKKTEKSIVSKEWQALTTIVAERWAGTERMKQGLLKTDVCDNVDCGKGDVRHNFLACGGCHSTYYCSKPCQTKAWKEGGHKDVCRLKQREREEAKSDPMHARDVRFMHAIALQDTRKNISLLRKLGHEKFPEVPISHLVIIIDYTIFPVTFDVQPISELKSWAESDASCTQIQRVDGLVARARESDGRYTLIKSRICCGEDHYEMQTLGGGKTSIWEGDFEVNEEVREDWDDEGSGRRGTLGDDIDPTLMRRSMQVLNRFVAARGEEPPF